MSRKRIGKKKITVAGITEDVVIRKFKNKNYYHAQQPPLKRDIEMTENFFTSGYFTKKEVDAIFLHEAYHKRSRLKRITDRFDFISVGIFAIIYFLFFLGWPLMFTLFGVPVFLLIYFSVNTPLNRKEERSADEFSARLNGKENLISALEKLYAVNKHNVLYRFFYNLYHYGKKERLRHIASL